MKIALGDLIIDRSLQIRHGLDEQTVLHYMEVFNGLPPVDVYRTAEGLYLVDGFHRIEAALRLGLDEIECTVHRGTREEARLFAAKANLTHGKPYTPAERRDLVRLLRDAHPDWSSRHLAKEAGVEHPTVINVQRADAVKAALEQGGKYLPPPVLSETQRALIGQLPKEEHWEPVARAAAQRKWTQHETAQAVHNLRDDAVTTEEKQALLAGQADPVVVTAEGERDLLPETRRRQEATEQADQRALERALGALRALRRYQVATLAARLDRPTAAAVDAEMAAAMDYLQELRHALAG